MGTTQRLAPGVSNEPNWGDLSKSVTIIAKTVETEKSLGNNNIDPQEEKYQQIIRKRHKYLQSAVKQLIKTGGGEKKVTNGKSSSIGKAGIKSAQKIKNFFIGVGNVGLQQTLINIDANFGSLASKTLQEVVDFLLIFCSDSNEGMDETAANNASCEVMKDIAKAAGNSIDKFEQMIKECVGGKGLTDLLCKFWGLYIFEHLSQRFEEKVKQQKGVEIGKKTFEIIKDDILGQVKLLNNKESIAKINWKGSSGKKEIEKIFNSIIKIICNEND
ncbi:MAG: hypothetical protein MUC49_21355 [Raineya sp.]|jgi:hypothetical protein|nr:hypothetical protein [Raineya sp.]